MIWESETYQNTESAFQGFGISTDRSYRSIVAKLGGSASAISREVARNRADADCYQAIGVVSAARGRRRRGLVKLREGCS